MRTVCACAYARMYTECCLKSTVQPCNLNHGVREITVTVVRLRDSAGERCSIATKPPQIMQTQIRSNGGSASSKYEQCECAHVCVHLSACLHL